MWSVKPRGRPYGRCWARQLCYFVLPLIPGPLPGWIDSVHHTLSRNAVEPAASSSEVKALSESKLSLLSSKAEAATRAYIQRLNAYDSDGIVAHVTERYRQSALDKVFISSGLGSQIQIENLTAAKSCDESACRVDVIARISGNQFTGADAVEIELAYIVKQVNGIALVDEFLN